MTLWKKSDKGGLQHRLKMIFVLTPEIMYDAAAKGKVHLMKYPRTQI